MIITIIIDIDIDMMHDDDDELLTSPHDDNLSCSRLQYDQHAAR
jgi:hypothetical protein